MIVLDIIKKIVIAFIAIIFIMLLALSIKTTYILEWIEESKNDE